MHQTSNASDEISLVATGHPALPTDPVPVSAPGSRVLATRTVLVANLAGTVGPEAVVEAVVGSSLAGGKRLTLRHGSLHWHGHGHRCGGQSRGVSGEGRHLGKDGQEGLSKNLW